MPAFECDRGFISKLLQTKDMLSVKDAQIRADFFSGESRAAYNYIYEITLETGEVPTVRAFKRQFPNYELETVYDPVADDLVVGTEENLAFWCKELRNKKKQNTLAEATEDIVQSLEDFKTETAYAKMKQVIAYVESEVEETHDIDITQDTEARKLAYMERKKHRGITGVPTGITHLDNLLRGLAPQTLTTLIANPGVGKALTLDTPVLTENGFIPMGEIKVGAKVIGSDGKAYPVTAVYPQGVKDVYRVAFNDYTWVDCCENHLWMIKTKDDVKRGKDWRVCSTKDLINNYALQRGHSYNLCIPVCKPVHFEKKELLIHPYVLGCLLGDGGFTTDRISFTNPETDIVDKINALVEEPFKGRFILNKATPCQYLFKSNDKRENKLYRAITAIGLKGLKSGDKFIPEQYLYSSVEDRLALLHGLIDTDGSVNKKGAVSFATGSDKLARDILWLIRSLGYRCTHSKYFRNNAWEHSVRIAAKEILFTSEKHLQRFENRKQTKNKHHYEYQKIVSIKKIGAKEPMQCITVDSPDHTFICGDFIVTHNTWLEVYIGAYSLLHNYRVIQFVTEMSDTQMRDRYEAMLYSMCYGQFNYENFKRGLLDRKTEKKYFRFLEEDLPNFEPLQLVTATGVMSVSAAIDKYKPDLVLIDGVYLMDDDQGADSDWLRVAHITRDLKKLAKRTKLPFFINSQADKNTSKKTGPELSSISYSQAIGQDSDNVLSLFRDATMIADKEMCIKVLKQREGENGKAFMQWDFDNMSFKAIYGERESGDNQERSFENGNEITDKTLNVYDDD